MSQVTVAKNPPVDTPWPAHKTRSKITTSAGSLRLLHAAVVEEAEEGAEPIIPMKDYDKTRVHNFKNYDDGPARSNSLPDKSPHQDAVNARFQEVLEGQRVKKKREKKTGCCVIL